jgi:NAD(P)H-hydrate epimerase
MARQAAVEHVRSLTIVLAGGRPADDSDPGRMLAACEALGIPIMTWPERSDDVRACLSEAAWIFDGIAGTGIRGALRPPLSDLVEAANASPGRRIAIDVPSGVGDEYRPGYPAFRADFTLTMGLPKLCLYLPHARVLCGRIMVIHVGFPPTLLEDPEIPGELLRARAWRKLAPPIAPDTYKNRRGHLAVFAGARGTTGAAWLSASAAARSRLGLVTLFADAEAYPIVAQKLTSVMCRPWSAEEEWEHESYSGILAGPGWGLTEEKERWLERLLALPLKGVIDADGITLLGRIASRGTPDLGGRWVLTPHPGEFARLTASPREEVLADPVRHSIQLSARMKAVIVLKGHCTIVATPSGRYWILDGANPALATGGSGDVLAGIIAGGIAGGMSPADAALFGVSLHAAVGRLAARRSGWFLAEDLVPLISRVLSR